MIEGAELFDEVVGNDATIDDSHSDIYSVTEKKKKKKSKDEADKTPEKNDQRIGDDGDIKNNGNKKRGKSENRKDEETNVTDKIVDNYKRINHSNDTDTNIEKDKRKQSEESEEKKIPENSNIDTGVQQKIDENDQNKSNGVNNTTNDDKINDNGDDFSHEKKKI